jgi:hypothetical protein
VGEVVRFAHGAGEERVHAGVGEAEDVGFEGFEVCV